MHNWFTVVGIVILIAFIIPMSGFLGGIIFSVFMLIHALVMWVVERHA